jgi:chitinase
MFNGNQWVSFDEINSYRLRAAYVVAKKLGGLFVFSIDMDDFTGDFCGMGPYPLLRNR